MKTFILGLTLGTVLGYLDIFKQIKIFTRFISSKWYDTSIGTFLDLLLSNRIINNKHNSSEHCSRIIRFVEWRIKTIKKKKSNFIVHKNLEMLDEIVVRLNEIKDELKVEEDIEFELIKNGEVVEDEIT